MFERFTDGARQVVVRAQEEARSLDHDFIGTEHLLLAVLTVSDSIAARALHSLGVSLDGVRQQVEVVVGRGETPPDSHIPFTRRAKKALELALREALELQHNHIGTEHILLGITREGEGVGVRILEDLGVLPEDVRAWVLQLLTESPGDPTPEENVSVEVEMALDVSQAGDEPRCARCNAEAIGNLRARTVAVPPGSTGGHTHPVTLLWCGVCGAVFGAVPATRDTSGVAARGESAG